MAVNFKKKRFLNGVQKNCPSRIPQHFYFLFFYAQLEAAAAGRLQRLESRLLEGAPSRTSPDQKELTFSGWRAEVTAQCAF